MTKNKKGYVCGDCQEHNGRHCKNKKSDHYGHFVAHNHPAFRSKVLTAKAIYVGDHGKKTV